MTASQAKVMFGPSVYVVGKQSIEKEFVLKNNRELFSYGKIPYPGMSNSAVMKQVAEGYRMPAPDNCPVRVYELMKLCWNKDPNERPSWSNLSKEFDTLLEENQQPVTIMADCPPVVTEATESAYN